MTLKLQKDVQAEAVKSIERYFQEHWQQRIGNIQAGALLNFFLEEVAPCVYNQAIADAQERLQTRVSELDIELHEEAFGYWPKYDQSPRKR
jgi:uncharacterized protein (DUF2164 family)